MFLLQNILVAVFAFGAVLAICDVKQCAWRRLVLRKRLGINVSGNNAIWRIESAQRYVG